MNIVLPFVDFKGLSFLKDIAGPFVWRFNKFVRSSSFYAISAIWGEFAYKPTKLTFEKPTDPVKETLSRAAGNRLYDKISIAGSISKNSSMFYPSLSYCQRELPSLKSAAYTAPAKRMKSRANVLELFEKSYTPPPSGPIAQAVSTPHSGGETHKCIIELDDGDGYGKIRSGSSYSCVPRAGLSETGGHEYRLPINNVLSTDHSNEIGVGA
ncbi:hypothetical protein Y032_0002g837 [Ancylostoma ceylanicum]|uniref:Uncharacterized protein n=1 Tax=Ancylostoma ceylanicum TaxID=53326 RepID=A0A016W2K8_9BILA|nr:hypothetical protein Y032_0002g837 [Ancylostoma ceylanicum]